MDLEKVGKSLDAALKEVETCKLQLEAADRDLIQKVKVAEAHVQDVKTEAETILSEASTKYNNAVQKIAALRTEFNNSMDKVVQSPRVR